MVYRAVRSRFLFDSVEDLGEDGSKVLWHQRSAFEDREIQVLGESIGLDEALLQTGAALEDPGASQEGIDSDTRQLG